MTGRDRKALWIAGYVAAGALSLWGLAVATPLLLGHIDHRIGAIVDAMHGESAGATGLIYVESPEVYTRQRLVNDRYLQDAWLREQLRRIDEPGQAWLDRAQVEIQQAVVGLLAGGGTAPEAAAPELSAELVGSLTRIPFETQFKLQAEARDKIRQLILENALDDRHDLSGNTVFGLKFDTSILPASRSRLHPTVIVQMEATPLEELLSGGRVAAEFVGHFLRVTEFEPSIDAEQRKILNRIDEDFDEWLATVRRRIEEYQKDISPPAPACLPFLRQDPLCAQIDTKLDRAPYYRRDPAGDADTNAVLDAAERLVSHVAVRAETPDKALAWVTRRDDDGDIHLAQRLQATLSTYAQRQCAISPDTVERETAARTARGSPEALLPVASAAEAIAGRTLGQFFADVGAQATPFQIMPGGWGRYASARALTQPKFQWDEKTRTDTLCPGEVQIEIKDRQISIYMFPKLDSGGPNPSRGTDLVPISCDRGPAETDDVADCSGFSTYIHSAEHLSTDEIDDLQSLLEPRVLVEIEKVIGLEAGDGPGPRICRFSGKFGDPVLVEVLVGPERSIEDIRAGLPAGSELADCVPGRVTQLRLGAYEFFRRMAEVESYTYAAFPRGDVSGVVTEAGRRRGLTAAAEHGGVAGWAGFEDERRERAFEAVPAVINFASGQSRIGALGRAGTPDLFDFGWSVVKAGNKEPMMVSQLVLVSVPAYLDEINLTLWKGFLDLDRVPTNRRAAFYRGAEDGDGSAFSDLTLEDRVGELMVGWEKRTITLNVPPDFTALDSIVIGPDEIFGPQIDETAFEDKAGEPICLRAIPVTEPAVEDRPARTHYELDLAIPGERLWRSTVVTVGGLKAEAIEVMPDMRGILTRFRFPDDPNARGNRADNLFVWTSEGRDSIPVEFCARNPGNVAMSPQAGADGAPGGTTPVSKTDNPADADKGTAEMSGG